MTDLDLDFDIDDLISSFNKTNLDSKNDRRLFLDWATTPVEKVFQFKSSYTNSPIALKKDPNKDLIEEFEANGFDGHDDLPSHIEKLQKQYNLNSEEATVLYVYTLQEGDYFGKVNSSLRAYRHKAFESFIFHLNNAIKKVNKAQTCKRDTVLYRGMSGAWSDKNPDVVLFKGFTSSSSSKAVADSFAGRGVILKIVHHSSAADIALFSKFNESEYLFPPYTRFKVEGYDVKKGVVTLKEM